VATEQDLIDEKRRAQATELIDDAIRAGSDARQLAIAWCVTAMQALSNEEYWYNCVEKLHASGLWR
jgi:hypothetical protein